MSINPRERRTRGLDSHQPQGIVRVRLTGPFTEEGAQARRVRVKIIREEEEETDRELEEVDDEDKEITVWPSELNDDADDDTDGGIAIVSYMGDTKRYELISMKGVYIGKPHAEIPARSGATPGSGRFDLWRFKNDGTDALEDSGKWVTAFNTTSAALPAGMYAHAVPHLQGARWLTSNPDCG